MIWAQLISNVFMYLSIDDQFTHFIAHTHTSRSVVAHNFSCKLIEIDF